MHTIEPGSLLKRAFVADAVVTGAVAALQLLFAPTLSQLLGLPQVLLLATGAFLGIYALLLAGLARSGRIWRMIVITIIAGNIVWAFGCIESLAGSFIMPTAPGTLYLLLQAITVTLFATLEYLGLKRSAPAARLQTVGA